MAAALAAVATPACGLGAGESSEGEATLTVTRDYGAETMLEASQTDPPATETVIRFLDREAELQTRFGGGFVQSIDGVGGGVEGGRSVDWFYFVNGIESSRGAAEVGVEGGDRIWWDLRDWTNAMRVPAVVGSWPEPFAQASAGADRLPVRIECRAATALCNAASEQLSDEDVDSGTESGAGAAGDGDETAIRVLVGPWSRVGSDPVAAQLEDGPAASGVFARFEPGGSGDRLVLLDVEARAARQLGDGAGLVAALGARESAPTWLVTGTDAAGVMRAVSMLDTEALSDRYAVAAAGSEELALPVSGSG